MNYLIVIDMQKDFITGSLGTEQAQAILPRVLEKVRHFEGKVLFTKDTHTEDYLNTREGRNLPVRHCIRGEEGWELEEALEDLVQVRGYRVYEKDTFGSVELAADLKAENDGESIEGIELCGLCTDICVISNALLCKAFMPETPISVDAACCAGVTPESHRNALEAMRMCQIIIQNNESI